MPETEIPSPNSPAFETAHGRPAIALSEENLLALLGSPSPAVKPAPSQAAAPVEPALAQLSFAQPPSVQPAPVQPPAAQAPIAERGDRTTPAPAPQPPPGIVDSKLALLAAIKESRAGLLRTEVLRTEAFAKPVPQPVPADTAAPAPFSTAEKIDRHPAMPPSGNVSVPDGVSLPRFLAGAPAPSPLAAAIGKLPGGSLTLLIVGALIAVGGISAGLILRSHRAAQPAVVASAVPVPPPAPAAVFPLQLQVEAQGKGQVNIRWNPQSAFIAQSREGRLVVTEANQQPRTIPLSPDQLKVGYLTYPQQSERAEFRLDVVDPSGSAVEESVLSLATPAPAPAVSAGAQKIAAPAPADVAPAPQGNRSAARAFTPPAVDRAPEQGSIVDAPPVLAANPAVPASFVNAPVAGSAALPPPAANAPSATPATRQIQVDSNLQAAKLTRKITPAYPPLAKSARVHGAVHFKATIGPDGAVRNLEVVSGPPLLRQAAADAVKQWSYRPTLLNGQPVEVVTTIDVLFTLGQ